MGARGTTNIKRQYAGGATELLKQLTEVAYRDFSAYQLRDGVVGGRAGVAQDAGSTKEILTADAVRVRINGEDYVVPPTSGIAVGTNTVAANKWIAYYLTVDETGAITVTTSEIGAGVGTADTEMEALLSILAESDAQLPAGEVLIAVVTLQGLAAGFTGGTDIFNVSDAGVQAINYYDVYESNNGIVAIATAFAQSATTKEMDISAVTAKMNGQRVVLAADTDFPINQNDTINTGAAAQPFWGGWMIVQDTSGNIHVLNAKGGAITAVDMIYETKALATAALDTLRTALDRIPILVEVGRLFIQAKLSDTFTANTEVLNVSDAAVDAIDFDIEASDDADYATTPTASASNLKPPPSFVVV